MHFYNFQNTYWQFDHREQPDPANGLQDYASGGYMHHGGYYWNFYDFTDHHDFYQVAYPDPAGGQQPLLTYVRVQYHQAAIEPEVVLAECHPTHSSGEVLEIGNHPYSSYNGKYCRTEDDWNGHAHWETITGEHFYRFDIPSNDPPLTCYLFDNTPRGEAQGLMNGGSMCDPTHDYTMDLIFSDANYQYVLLFNQWWPLTWALSTEEPQESDGNEEIYCTPTHESGEVLHIYYHPIPEYNGFYCRMEDWNDYAHYATDSGMHFYYFYASDSGYSCYLFDAETEDAPEIDYTAGTSAGGSMCDNQSIYSVEAIMASANYRYVYLGQWYGPLYFEEDYKEPGPSGNGGGGGNSGPVNESIQNEDGSYMPARSVEQFFQLLVDCETFEDVMGVVWATLMGMMGMA